MCRGKQNLVASWPKEPARRLANPGRNAVRLAGLEIKQIDLIEGILRLAFALENKILPVGGEVPFATAFAFENKLTDFCEELGFAARRPKPFRNQE